MTLTAAEREAKHKAERVVREFNRRERKAASKGRAPSPKATRGRVKEPAYLRWLRTLPCAVAHVGRCSGPIQAAHLRTSDAAAGRINPGMQRKPDDSWATPLCAHHHAEQHRGNERAFWSAAGIDPTALCLTLRTGWGG